MELQARRHPARRALRVVGCSSVLVIALGGPGWRNLDTAMAQAVRLPNAVLSSSVAHPTWVKGLGTDITVLARTPTPAGHSSPAAPVQGEVNATNQGRLVQTCQCIEPSYQAECRKELAGAPASDVPTFKTFAIGYVVIDGGEALVGATGTFCSSHETPRCSTNRDPAAILSTGKLFKVLWPEAVAASNSSANSYSLAPCVEVGHNWYVYVGSAT